jgi:[ribosomal protein S18]-alanine N-acetyltransferase
LRGYRAGDVDLMVRLDEACFGEAFRFDRRSMRRFAEARGASVVVAEEALELGASGAMAGFVIAQLEGAATERYGYVVTLDVAPELRRAGLGGRLLTEAERQVRAAGVGRMGLHVAVDNDAAIRFYERLGYACVGVAKRFYSEAGLDGLIYLKDLV